MKTWELPLLSRTPLSWAESVLHDVPALLNDHAFLEKKAANNALELISRWPGASQPRGWVTTLSAIARDETRHLVLVCRLLHRRGGQLAKTHRNTYANGLRQIVRAGQGRLDLADRLMVSALIEARSCERFEVLGRAAREVAEPDAELARLYQGLWASEMNHFRVFFKLAGKVLPRDQVETRWQEFLHYEVDILSQQSPGPRMHSGV